MSKLDELIKELCPNGVEYKRLGEVIHRHSEKPKNTNIKLVYTVSKDYGIIESLEYWKKANSEKTVNYQMYSEDTSNYNVIRKNMFAYNPARLNIGSIGCLLEKQEGLLSPMYVIFKIDETQLLPRYVLYYLKSPKILALIDSKKENGARFRFDFKNWNRIFIPVPPLEIQKEIVRILDNFLDIISELIKELTARKKQYSWYRDYFLKFENKIKIVKLGELFDFKNGINKEKSSFGKGTPIINYVNVYKKNKIYFEDLQNLVETTSDELTRYKVKRGDVFFTRTSETIEEIGFTSVLLEDIENCVFSGFLLRARPLTDLLLPEYCAYCFSTSSIRNAIIRKSTYTTRALINGTSLSQIEIPLPPLEVQKRIVEVLDNFEKICNDLNIGLPAEIEARQKQYEFYRNFLLTFNNEEIYALSKQASKHASKQAQHLIKILQYVYGYVELELDKVANITMGVSPSGNSITDIKSGKNIEFHQGKTYFGETMLLQSNVYTNEPKKYAEKNSIVMSVRAPVGDTNMVNRKISIGRGLCSILADEKISLTKYLYYYIKSNVDKLKAMSNGSTFEAINSESIRKFTVSLPPLEEQQRIVDILDRFDKLCNDISEGLPAEIEARQKQYEYYREKLLSFKKL